MYCFLNWKYPADIRDHYRYIKSLHAYLLSFTKRAQPLVDIETLQREAEEVFTRQWEAGEIEGWEEIRHNKSTDGEGEGIWCAACECFEPIGILCLLTYGNRSENVFEADSI